MLMAGIPLTSSKFSCFLSVYITICTPCTRVYINYYSTWSACHLGLLVGKSGAESDAFADLLKFLAMTRPPTQLVHPFAPCPPHPPVLCPSLCADSGGGGVATGLSRWQW